MPPPHDDVDFDFYPYNPSAAAGYAFLVLFAAGTLVHLCYLIPYRTWFFIPFVLGCAAETGGYYGRAWAHNNTRMGDPYLLQLFLIIGATPLLSASIYMSLPRLTRALHAEEYSSIRISWLSKIYILIDIACLVLQVLGTVMQAYGSKDQQGEAVHIIAGGLGFQLAAFVVFMLLAFQIHRRLNKDPTFVSSRLTWRPYFWILYATSALVLVRNLVRIVEFVQGGDGNIASHEAFLYVFEAWPMLMVVLGMAIFYPGRMLKNARQMSKVEDEDVVLVSEA